MKRDYKYILSLTAVGLAFVAVCFAGPGVIISPPTVVISPPIPPAVVVSPPVATVVVAPDDYVWDGYEYVGVVDGQYYYLGPSDTWIVCDPVRMQHFQIYERDHPDWRSHMTHNVKYHNMDRSYYNHSQPQPMHDTHGQPPMMHNQPMPDNQSQHNDHDLKGSNRGDGGPPQ